MSLVGGALAWDVLIASCTANSNFISEFSETLRAPLPQAPRSSQMVQNLRILVQTRPPRPGGVVNKTQPKAPQTRDTFAMKTLVSVFRSGNCQLFTRNSYVKNNILHWLTPKRSHVSPQTGPISRLHGLWGARAGLGSGFPSDLQERLCIENHPHCIHPTSMVLAGTLSKVRDHFCASAEIHGPSHTCNRCHSACTRYSP